MLNFSKIDAQNRSGKSNLLAQWTNYLLTTKLASESKLAATKDIKQRFLKYGK